MTNRKRHKMTEVTKGKYEGALHVSTKRYSEYFGELHYLQSYLNRRVVFNEHEEIPMRDVILNIQNIIESEIEFVIQEFKCNYTSNKDLKFYRRLNNGFVSFKDKYSWLQDKGLITKDEYDFFEEIRVIRNSYAHSRPTKTRIRRKYKGKPLLRRAVMHEIFLDAEKIRQQLIVLSKNKNGQWPLIPPGYAEELNWEELA